MLSAYQSCWFSLKKLLFLSPFFFGILLLPVVIVAVLLISVMGLISYCLLLLVVIVFLWAGVLIFCAQVNIIAIYSWCLSASLSMYLLSLFLLISFDLKFIWSDTKIEKLFFFPVFLSWGNAFLDVEMSFFFPNSGYYM